MVRRSAMQMRCPQSSSGCVGVCVAIAKGAHAYTTLLTSSVRKNCCNTCACMSTCQVRFETTLCRLHVGPRCLRTTSAMRGDIAPNSLCGDRACNTHKHATTIPAFMHHAE